jgi:ethanolamine utilization protein EutN
MFLARVTGSVVSSQKVDAMVGQKLLVVEPLRVNEKDQTGLVGTGRTFITVDTVGAGEGEVVLIVQGSSARFTPQTKPLPVDCAIIGIVDTVHLASGQIFDSKTERADN